MNAVANLAAVLTILAGAAQAASQKVSPSLYHVDGRPVPVSCLAALTGDDSRKTPIDLRRCGNPSLKPKAQADGSVGYDDPQGGYFYYRYLGNSGGIDVLSLQSSGGGSGHFTQLVGVTHDGHFVRWAKDYAGGDRCNGGVSEEKISNGQLTFDQAITPFDLIELSRPNVKLEAYKDLEASASSCIGTSHMAGDDKHWTGASLTETDLEDQKGWTESYRYQACFNKLYRSTLSRGRSELDRGGITAFGRAFVERCVQRR